MSIKSNRTIKHFSIADDNTVYFRFRGSSSIKSARILEANYDEDGLLMDAILDRLIHRDYETEIDLVIPGQAPGKLQVSGCYVTEIKT